MFTLIRTLKTHPNWLLPLGVLLMTCSHLSYTVSAFAWVAMVPFLIHIRLTSAWRSRLLFVLALCISWSLSTAKILSAPIPWYFILLYAIPITLIHLPGYLIASWRTSPVVQIFAFPAAMVILEWIQYSFTPLGSWGAAGYMVHDQLAIIQWLSLLGLPGLSFLIYWFNAALADLFLQKKATLVNVYLPLGMLTLVLLFGSLRVSYFDGLSRESIKVAAIGTTSEVTGLPLPAETQNEADIQFVLAATKKAAQAGANLAIWNEAAFYILPSQENQWLDTFSQFAAINNISLVASYVVPVSEQPFQFENKYVFIDYNGTQQQTYLKHKPVPGEPAIKGTEVMQVHSINNSTVGGAICYDYDYPGIGRSFGQLNADLVAVPSSDWRGIDPLHTQMAAYRAIEQGHSILRSTRWGLSAGINFYGRVIGQQSAFNGTDKVLLVDLPAEGVRTVYSQVGNLLIWLCIAFLVVCGLYSLRRKPPHA